MYTLHWRCFSNELKTEKKFDQEESGKISVLVNLSTHSSSLLPLPQQQPYSQQIHQQHHPQQLYHQKIPYHGQHYAQPPPPQYNSLVQKQQQFNVFKPQLKRVLSPVRQQQQQHQEPLQSIPLPLQIDDLKQQPRDLYITLYESIFSGHMVCNCSVPLKEFDRISSVVSL